MKMMNSKRFRTFKMWNSNFDLIENNRQKLNLDYRKLNIKNELLGLGLKMVKKSLEEPEFKNNNGREVEFILKLKKPRKRIVI